MFVDLQSMMRHPLIYRNTLQAVFKFSSDWRKFLEDLSEGLFIHETFDVCVLAGVFWLFFLSGTNVHTSMRNQAHSVAQQFWCTVHRDTVLRQRPFFCSILRTR